MFCLIVGKREETAKSWSVYFDITPVEGSHAIVEKEHVKKRFLVVLLGHKRALWDAFGLRFSAVQIKVNTVEKTTFIFKHKRRILFSASFSAFNITADTLNTQAFKNSFSSDSFSAGPGFGFLQINRITEAASHFLNIFVIYPHV